MQEGVGGRALYEIDPVTWTRFNSHIHEAKMLWYGDDLTYDPKICAIITGPTRTGKTRFVFDLARTLGKRLYKCDNAHKGWYDGFDMHDIAVFDEFMVGKSTMDCGTFLNMTDGYAYRPEVKGSTTIWKPKVIIFTTNTPGASPAQWWPLDYAEPRRAEALDQRITARVDLTDDVEDNALKLAELREMIKIKAGWADPVPDTPPLSYLDTDTEPISLPASPEPGPASPAGPATPPGAATPPRVFTGTWRQILRKERIQAPRPLRRYNAEIFSPDHTFIDLEADSEESLGDFDDENQGDVSDLIDDEIHYMSD